MNRNKVLGMIVGGAVGDALGATVETWSSERIVEVHRGPITGYVPPIDHKWFKEDEFPLGSTTDDTQLALATMRGLIKGHREPPLIDFYMDAIAYEHCKAMKESTVGWGGSTRESVKNICNNVHWSESGKSDNPRRGTGNGVSMKIAPLAIVKSFLGESWRSFCVSYSTMTHYTKMSAYAAIMHAETCWACLEDDMDCSVAINDLTERLAEEWVQTFDFGGVDHLNDTEDDLRVAFELLRDKWTQEPIPISKRIELFGGGSCYLYHSLPFTYSFFLHPTDDPIWSLLNIVNAGGDTDTNGAMLGNLIGAMYGIELFKHPENRWTLDGLQGLDEIMEVANKFCDTFGIED